MSSSATRKIYECEHCQYISHHKHNYIKHLSSRRHNMKVINNNNQMNVTKIIMPKQKAISTEFSCNCGRVYKYKSGLSRHSLKCGFTIQNETIINLIKENQSVQRKVIELSQQSLNINTTTINNHNHSQNNNTFNLQFFLNETCKDAMSIQDFVHSICVTIEDLKRIGNSGYVEGVSALIINHLKDLDVTKRPLHCSDVKRETMYIKDNDVWEKDNEQKEKLKSVLNEINKRNVKAIQQYQSQYPDYNAHNSKVSNEYDDIVYECFGGKSENMNDSKERVIGRIASVVKVN